MTSDVLTSTEEQERIQWACKMRQLVSPKGMCNEDGSINQEFFRPTTVIVQEDKKWGDKERDLLYKGLEQFGVGQWREISDALLPQWDETSLRIKAARLMGSQSLARYVGWKGDRAAVDRERAANKAIGDATGCWKGGVLVEDNEGSVAKYLAQQSKGAAAYIAN